MQINYHVLNNSVILNFDGKTISVNKDDSRYNSVLQAIKDDKLETIPDLVDYEKQFSKGDIILKNGLLHLDNQPMPECLSDRVLQFQKENIPFDYLIKFAKKLALNPSFNSRQQLFKFLEHNGHPITKNGNFIAYRGVTSDFKDCHSRKFDNSVGSICEMDRESVDDNPNNTCSSGLHVACYDYAKGFGHTMIEVEVDPRDVVAVPTDYNGTKMRTCKFKVVNLCKQLREEPLYEDYDDSVDQDWVDSEDIEEEVLDNHLNDDFVDEPELLQRFNRKVDSSFIERLEYRNGNLTVTLTNGRVIRYLEVEDFVANGLLNAPSIGRYYIFHVKEQYDTKDIN